MKSLAKTLILIVLGAAAVSAQTSWDPEMQLKLKAVGTPRVSPDGKAVSTQSATL